MDFQSVDRGANPLRATFLLPCSSNGKASILLIDYGGSIPSQGTTGRRSFMEKLPPFKRTEVGSIPIGGTCHPAKVLVATSHALNVKVDRSSRSGRTLSTSGIVVLHKPRKFVTTVRFSLGALAMRGRNP